MSRQHYRRDPLDVTREAVECAVIRAGPDVLIR